MRADTRTKAKKAGRRKPVTYELLEPAHPIYGLLDELVEVHHEDLRQARIGIAWCVSWQADVDGRVTLGKCRRASDLDRELSAFDFVILLNRRFWEGPHVSDVQRRALLDHELSHAAVKRDDNGEPVRDARDRVVYRVRKHDLEEFVAIAERYGCWKRDLEAFARALDRAKHQVNDSWVGYSRVRRALDEVGASVTEDAVVAWTEAERVVALEWAILKREFPLGSDAPPAHVASVSTVKA